MTALAPAPDTATTTARSGMFADPGSPSVEALRAAEEAILNHNGITLGDLPVRHAKRVAASTAQPFPRATAS